MSRSEPPNKTKTIPIRAITHSIGLGPVKASELPETAVTLFVEDPDPLLDEFRQFTRAAVVVVGVGDSGAVVVVVGDSGAVVVDEGRVVVVEPDWKLNWIGAVADSPAESTNMITHCAGAWTLVGGHGKSLASVAPSFPVLSVPAAGGPSTPASREKQQCSAACRSMSSSP